MDPGENPGAAGRRRPCGRRVGSRDHLECLGAHSPARERCGRPGGAVCHSNEGAAAALPTEMPTVPTEQNERSHSGP